jgi:hypothetical protein
MIGLPFFLGGLTSRISTEITILEHIGIMWNVGQGY